MKIVVGQGSCGIATGAKKVANRFEEILGEKNIDINVDITGCIGTCFLEPIVDIYEDAKDEPTRYVKVKPEDVAEIVESHIEGGKVVENKEISEENKKQFYIPEGFAHGFLVLSDEAEFAYKCTDFYHPGDEGGILWSDPEIGIDWPIEDGMELIISDKDQKWSGIRDTFKF